MACCGLEGHICSSRTLLTRDFIALSISGRERSLLAEAKVAVESNATEKWNMKCIVACYCKVIVIREDRYPVLSQKINAGLTIGLLLDMDGRLGRSREISGASKRTNDKESVSNRLRFSLT